MKLSNENNKILMLTLHQKIDGWTEGIPLFKEVGNGVLLIPSS